MFHLLRQIPLVMMRVFSTRGLTAFNKLGLRIQVPIACLVGSIGYTIEGWVSKRYTPPTKPIKEQRQDRLLEELTNSELGGKPKKHDPLSFNLSPSLSK